MEGGAKYYCEHTSHHPPITNFQVEDPDGKYTLDGYYEVTGSMGANHLKSGLMGPTYVRFHDGHVIRYSALTFKLGGTVYGAREIEAYGSQVYEDLTNHRKAVILNNTYRTSGWVMKSHSGNKNEVVGVIYDSKKKVKGEKDKETIKKWYVKGAK